MRFTRRSLLQAAPAAALLPGLAPEARAAIGGADRKVLFVLCFGGWDTGMITTPMFDISGATLEDGAERADEGGLTWVSKPSTRPSVDSFFTTHAERTCIVNGFEVRSVTHERCLRIVMTGSTDATRDDWGAILAHHGEDSLLFPHVVISGPAFTYDYTNRVVRVGGQGQLPDLLSGAALEASELPVEPLPSEIEAIQSAYLHKRVAAELDVAMPGQPTTLLTEHLGVLERLDALTELGDLDLYADDAGCMRDLAEDAAVVFDCFEQGLSRCGMVMNEGWCTVGWDTHQNNGEMQDRHLELLFGWLDDMIADLESRPGTAGGETLADEVTIVVLSEMGRHPVENNWGGKDHWTTTSALLIGSGVQGGQVIGQLDESAAGEKVDLDSGEISDSGTALTAAHLGATILSLGGVDPAEYLDEDPITAAMS